LELPRGPLTVPAAVVVAPLLVVVPLALVVPPRGPVTEPLSVVPVLVLVAVALPETLFPLADVAVPLAVADLPDCVTELVAVPPRLPVAVFCVCAEASGRTRAIATTEPSFAMFTSISRPIWDLYLTTLTRKSRIALELLSLHSN
jgi:hypothetical protein